MKIATRKILITRPAAGFALIATIAMMSLLVMIALAMMSIAGSTIKTESASRAYEKARANARLALSQAIAELQKQMGPDQRISANGEIISHQTVNNSHWLGVWDSWHAGEPDPNASGKQSSHTTIVGVSDLDMNPSYEEGREDYFRRWLVSLPSDFTQDPITRGVRAKNLSSISKDLANGALSSSLVSDEWVKLVGDSTVGNDPSQHVVVPLLDIINENMPKGKFGWWVGDQSQKALLAQDSYRGLSLTGSDNIARLQAPGSVGITKVPGLKDLTDEESLGKLVSLQTVDLLELSTPPAVGSLTPSQLNFHHSTEVALGVPVDVREAGLKRDLSTILEQPIDLANDSDDFMLYRFKDGPHARVPIQDLSAFYQLYKDGGSWETSQGPDTGKRGGVRFTSEGPQVSQPNYDGIPYRTSYPRRGLNLDRRKFLREYTGIYRQPVPIKVEFMVTASATKITAEDRAKLKDELLPGFLGRAPLPSDLPRVTDTHKLHLGFLPVVTLWNPTNVRMVMPEAQQFKFSAPPLAFRWRKYRGTGGSYTNDYFNINSALHGSNLFDGRAQPWNPFVISFRIAYRDDVVFEPGEVKVFTIDSEDADLLTEGVYENTALGGRDGFGRTTYDPINEFDPFSASLATNSAVANKKSIPDAFFFRGYIGHQVAQSAIVFNENDKIDIEVIKESTLSKGTWVSGHTDFSNAGFSFHMIDGNYFHQGAGTTFLRNYQLLSRTKGYAQGSGAIAMGDFNARLMEKGFPNQHGLIAFEGKTNAIPGKTLISAGEVGEVVGLFDFSLNAACEASDTSTAGFGAGRKFATRPFLHSSTIAPPFIDDLDPASLYNSGWSWSVSRINNLEDSSIQAMPGTGNGFFGGGYTIEAGTTHVIQQEIPVLPPISIAALSHAHLGGYSLANSAMVSDAPYTETMAWNDSRIRGKTAGGRRHGHGNIRVADAFQRTVATGQGGLAPSILQAAANSYAHPNIPPDKAFTSKPRVFDAGVGPVEMPFVDHSYLVNKALYDDYFFSSVAPSLASTPYNGINKDKTAKQVAEEFFFGGGKLQNHRMVANKRGLSRSKFDQLFDNESGKYRDGLADKLAQYLMIRGAFNINSTSEEAWRALLTSMRNKPITHLDGSDLKVTDAGGTPIYPGMLPRALAVKTSDIDGDLNNVPERQWKTGRILSDEEVDQLAKAIVKQVKLRGPFLSLSEFVNRRLDASTPELSKKGALQSALDDADVDINKKFRSSSRTLDKEVGGMAVEFPEALEGSIAYGSTPYVDQADLLRNFAGILTPRGDTFVIRAYGDSRDDSGKILASAWCEATVQRLTEYIDNKEEAYLAQAALVSPINRKYGRKFTIVKFRWLNNEEI